MERRERALSISLVLSGVVSVQIGAALATTLFDDLGPAGTVFVRVAFSALVLAALWRPALRGLRGAARRDIALYGLSLAAMNLSFYAALDRIPLGIAVTLEFVGPLGVAFASSRGRREVVWAVLAGVGILLLAPIPGGSLDAAGVGLALFAGVWWGIYILLATRVGRQAPGGSGLALAMCFATVLLLVPGLIGGGAELADPELLGVGFAVAMLSSAIPYSVELEALRRLPQGVFGVLMSLEPGVAAVVGFVGLDQGLAEREVVAIALVVIASAGALRSAPVAVEA